MIYFYKYCYQIKFFFYKYCNQIKLLKLKNPIISYKFPLIANYNDISFKHYFSNAFYDKFFKYLKNYSKPFVFLDIGANQGLYTIIAANNKNCVRIFSFEPVFQVFNLLKKNLILNKKLNKSHLINKAISDKEGTQKIFYNKFFSGKSTLRNKKNLTKEKLKFYQDISCINYNKLNMYLKGYEDYNIVVKVDVEGLEFTVIKELFKSSFSKNINEIFYEVNINWCNPEKLKDYLKKKGFNYFNKFSNNQNHYDLLATKINFRN